ncbi:disks large homolog 5-like [Apodemus sylvaticus]|uniref:disks large homolog 5-like n=1 Tax=Apodemus sylvaticus TaxID=10129 RepID=UPI002243674F|nr:disks large homolog 5-like [Apodemus sylvaticus]
MLPHLQNDGGAEIHTGGVSKAGRQPSSSTPVVTKQQVKKETERLTTQLHKLTTERNELQDHLNVISEGPLENSNLHSQLLAELNHVKNNMEILREENQKMQEDFALLQQHLGEFKSNCENRQEEASDPQTQHQKHMGRMEEMLQYVVKQKEMAIKQKELARKLQHHFDVLQMRFEKLQHEMELATAQEESILQNDLLHQESPAEPSLQKPQNPRDGFTLTYYISSV